MSICQRELTYTIVFERAGICCKHTIRIQKYSSTSNIKILSKKRQAVCWLHSSVMFVLTDTTYIIIIKFKKNDLITIKGTILQCCCCFIPITKAYGSTPCSSLDLDREHRVRKLAGYKARSSKHQSCLCLFSSYLRRGNIIGKRTRFNEQG